MKRLASIAAVAALAVALPSAAQEELAKKHIHAEVIDLRTSGRQEACRSGLQGRRRQVSQRQASGSQARRESEEGRDRGLGAGADAAQRGSA